MYCPNCATENLEGASFCRICGANISLVPQALTGQLPQLTDQSDRLSRRERKRGGKEVRLEHAFKNIFMGIAFLLVAIALSFSIGRFWWFWMLIPAFSMMGTGIAQFIRLNQEQKMFSERGIPPQPLMPPPARANSLPNRHTGSMAPPSVTEGTTRHLGAEPPHTYFDGEDSKT